MYKGNKNIVGLYKGATAISKIYKGNVSLGTLLNQFDALAPSDLALTVLSETSIKLDWINNSTNADGVSIERSTDGTTYSELTTVSATTATYTDTTGADGIRYYYRLKAYKGSVYSAASTAANDWTAIKMVLTSTGTGTGVSTVKFQFSNNVVATLDGNGKWYSDAAGTLNESASYTFTGGSLQTRYLKVTSGVSNMIVFAKGNWIRFGDSSNNGFTSLTNAASISFTLSKLKTQTSFYCEGSNTISGALSGLPSGLTTFYCIGSNTISGTLSDLPSGLTSFYCEGSNTISGALSGLPSGLTSFYCIGSNTISGTLSDLPSGLTSFYCIGSNTISGTLSDLPSGLTYFRCTGYNTVSGALSGLPSGLTTFYCIGSNTISGALSGLPSGLTYFYCEGSNTISGTLSDLPSGLTYFRCTGSNTISEYTSGKDFANLMNYFYHVPVSGGGLSSTEIDNLIIDLNNGNTWGGSSRTLYLKGTNASRTSASDAAVASLIGKSVTVTTN